MTVEVRVLDKSHLLDQSSSLEPVVGLALKTGSNAKKRQMENTAGVLELDRRRSSHSSRVSGHESRTLPEVLMASLREFSNAENVAPFTTLVAAFATLLSRYSGQKQFLIGTSFGSSALLPWRVDLARDPSFRELLRRIRSEAVDQGESDGGLPLFQVALILEQPELEAVRLSGLGLDLALHLEEHSSGFLMTADYDTAVFDPDSIQHLLGQYETLLASAISNPEGPVSRLPVLTELERRRILYDWNSTTAQEYPDNVALQQLIEDQVERTPDAVAVSFKDENVTYAELNARANQLAARLRSLGVTANTLVGVCLERSIDVLIAPLAILKAGGAYLPLDPDHPDDRIGPIVEDAGIEILIGRRALAVRLPKFRGKFVFLDWEALERYPKTNHEVAVSGSDLAYVIYTSGSTGKPKGVMIPRRALNNLLWSLRGWYQFSSQDVLLALTTMAFDISGIDLWLPLMVGARILMIDRATAMHARLLQDTIHREGVTFLQCTPAIWKLLIDSGWPGEANMQAVSGGEAMPNDLARKLLPRVRRLWNMYGPTETTIWSTGYKFSGPDDPVLIGRPVANTQVYILDEQLVPVPIGVPGELYIGGDGLADGYLHKPQLTADRFVANPFSKRPGDRLYKTGDLARYRSDGNIECLGRNDDQIKLRGYRIEPEEIRTALLRHPSVRDAIAVLEASAAGESRIVAYLISETSPPPRGSELRAFLRRSLPGYMIPASFAFLESFPLNGNGKIDRRALPQQKTLSPEIAGRDAPADAVESRLRNVFRSVLGLNDIGVNEDFFDLGGHSLMAARLFSDINICFKLDLPLATLFHAPTVRSLAALIRDSASEQMSAPIVQIQGGRSKPAMYCIGGVDGELIVFRRLAIELGLDQPLYGLQPFRLLSPLITVKQLASAYIDELRRRAESQPPYLLGYSFGGLVAVEIAHQLERAGVDPPIVMLIDTAYRPGCMVGESWPHRVRRYRYNWKQIAGGKGLSHVVERVKDRLARLARSASFAIGVPLPNSPNDVYSVQGRAEGDYRITSHKGRVYLFRAESQPEFFHGGQSLGWSRVLSDLVIEDVPGDHGTMNTGINLKILAQKIRDSLQRPPASGRQPRV